MSAGEDERECHRCKKMFFEWELQERGGKVYCDDCYDTQLN